MRIVFVLLVLGVSFFGIAGPQLAGRVERVVAGNTISVRIEAVLAPLSGFFPGTVIQARYVGVSFSEAEAENAYALNSLLVGGKQVFLEVEEKAGAEDGSVLAYVFLDREGWLMVNAILVATPVFSFVPTPGANRYDHLLQYFDNPPSPPSLVCSVLYSWNEAGRHVGERACVEGPVASVGTSRGGDVFLNLGKPYPDPNRFTLFIPARHVGKFEVVFGPRFWTNLLGRTVLAQGEIRLYQGVPEIELSDPSNLSIP